jgi:hypothetical protein
MNWRKSGMAAAVLLVAGTTVALLLTRRDVEQASGTSDDASGHELSIDDADRWAVALVSPDPEYRGRAEERLVASAERSIPILRSLSRSDATEVALRAIALLERLGARHDQALIALAEVVAGRDEVAKFRALEALRRAGPRVRVAEGTLCDALLVTQTDATRWEALRVFVDCGMGQRGRQYVRGILEGPDGLLKVRAAQAMLAWGLGAELQEVLGRMLSGGTREKQLDALQIAGVFGRELSGLTMRIVGCLQNQDATVRLQAVVALGSFGQDAREALPHLRRMVLDDDPAVRRAVIEATANITE